MLTKKPRPTTPPVAAFWDASAIIPLCCQQSQSAAARRAARIYNAQIVWWGTSIEAFSAIYRLTRDGGLTATASLQALKALELLRKKWHEILPAEEIRLTAERLLRTHPLRAADALQLGAVLVWGSNYPRGHAFICADSRLAEAADEGRFQCNSMLML